MNKKTKIIIAIIGSVVIIAVVITIIVVVVKNKNKDKNKITPYNPTNIPNTNEKNTDAKDDNNDTDNKDENNYYNSLFQISEKKANLNNGYQMPILGLGTWTLSNAQAEESVYNAIKTGFRLIDTAEYYGNEVGVGKGVKKSIEEGIVKREDIFITSKIMPGAYSNPDVAIEDSLKNLDVDYIDLMLIHQPGNNDERVYRSMEKYYNQGKLKAIGISNYYTKNQVDKVLSYAKVIPAIIQNENHIFYQNNELQEYVKKNKIIIESWYPFGGRGHTSESFNNDVIKKLASKYNKTSAQIIIRWHLQAGYIVIPGSSNAEHIRENYNVFDFELSQDDMKEIYNVNINKRYEYW